MAYDAAIRSVVLFGGQSAASATVGSLSDLNDTWTFDGRRWTQQHPTVNPPPREGAVMAYDDHSRQVVLMGGYERIGNSVVGLRDQWAWDGKDWSRETPADMPTWEPTPDLVFDPTADRLVMLSPAPGFNGSHPEQGNFQATSSDRTVRWLWNGAGWSASPTPTAPPVQVGPAGLVWDRASRQLIYYSYIPPSPSCPRGINCIPPDPTGTRYSQTWTWNGRTWTQRRPDQAPQFSSMIVEDSASGHATVVDADGSVWSWVAGEWNADRPTGPTPHYGQAAAYDAKIDRLVVYCCTDGTDATWLWDGATWTKLRD